MDVPGIGRIHPLRRANRVANYIANYDPFVHPQRSKPTAGVLAEAAQARTAQRQKRAAAAQDRHRHGELLRILKGK